MSGFGLQISLNCLELVIPPNRLQVCATMPGQLLWLHGKEGLCGVAERKPSWVLLVSESSEDFFEYRCFTGFSFVGFRRQSRPVMSRH